MRRAVRRLLLLGAVVAAALLGANPASAEIVSCPSCVGDGPSIALISNPATNSAAMLPITQADNQLLDEALEYDGPVPGVSPADREAVPIYVTWLTPDDAILDIDLVRLGSDGELWVRPNTPPDVGGAGLGRGEGTWHTAADPEAALGVLKRAGVLSTDSSSEAEAAGDANADGATPVGAGSQDGSAGVLTGWWWLLPGAAAGVALGLGVRPAVAAPARRREPGPRHQLIG